jgi:hypothetical protein
VDPQTDNKRLVPFQQHEEWLALKDQKERLEMDKLTGTYVTYALRISFSSVSKISSFQTRLCFSTQKFDIDRLTSVDPSSRSLVVLPGSRVRPTGHEKPSTYDFVRGELRSVIRRSLSKVFRDLDVKIKIDSLKSKSKSPERAEKELESELEVNDELQIDDETAQRSVDGLTGLEIHNDGGGMTLEDEVTLFTLLPAINSLPDKYVKRAYKKNREECEFTETAEENYKRAKRRYSTLKTHSGVLLKIIRI